jgi:hypothetical protein
MGQKEEKFSTLRARHFGRRIVEAFGKLLTISLGTSEDSLGTVISFRWPQYVPVLNVPVLNRKNIDACGQAFHAWKCSGFPSVHRNEWAQLVNSFRDLLTT